MSKVDDLEKEIQELNQQSCELSRKANEKQEEVDELNEQTVQQGAIFVNTRWSYASDSYGRKGEGHFILTKAKSNQKMIEFASKALRHSYGCHLRLMPSKSKTRHSWGCEVPYLHKAGDEIRITGEKEAVLKFFAINGAKVSPRQLRGQVQVLQGEIRDREAKIEEIKDTIEMFKEKQKKYKNKHEEENASWFDGGKK